MSDSACGMVVVKLRGWVKRIWRAGGRGGGRERHVVVTTRMHHISAPAIAPLAIALVAIALVAMPWWPADFGSGGWAEVRWLRCSGKRQRWQATELNCGETDP